MNDNVNQYLNERIHTAQAEREAYFKKRERALQLLRDDVQRLVEKQPKAPWANMRAQAIDLLIDDFNREKQNFNNEYAWLVHGFIKEAKEITTKLFTICSIHGISPMQIEGYLQWSQQALKEHLTDKTLHHFIEIEGTDVVHYQGQLYEKPHAFTSYEEAKRQAMLLGPIKRVSLLPDKPKNPPEPKPQAVHQPQETLFDAQKNNDQPF